MGAIRESGGCKVCKKRAFKVTRGLRIRYIRKGSLRMSTASWNVLYGEYAQRSLHSADTMGPALNEWGVLISEMCSLSTSPLITPGQQGCPHITGVWMHHTHWVTPVCVACRTQKCKAGCGLETNPPLLHRLCPTHKTTCWGHCLHRVCWGHTQAVCV